MSNFIKGDRVRYNYLGHTSGEDMMIYGTVTDVMGEEVWAWWEYGEGKDHGWMPEDEVELVYRKGCVML